MERLIKISQQTMWQLLGKVVTSITTFIFLGVVARNYGESGIGTFTLILTYLSIFYLFGDFGFNAHLLKNFQSAQDLQRVSLFRRLMGTRLVWAGALVVLSIITLPFWPFATDVFSIGVLIGSLAIVASAVFVTNNLVFQTKLRYDLSVIASSLGTIVGLVSLALFVNTQAPLQFLVLSHMLGWVVIAVTASFLVRRFTVYTEPIFEYKFSLSLIKNSWPIALTLTLNVIYFRADAFILSSLKTNSEVGIYNLAYSVFQSVLVLPTFIMNAYYPLMLKSLTDHPEQFFKQFRMAGVALVIIAATGSIFIYSAASLIISVLSGGGFASSVTVLRILAIGFPGYFLSALLMWLFVIKGRYKPLMVIYGLGLLFNLTANFIFIPTHSYIASSWITVVSEYVILSMQLIMAPNLLRSSSKI